MHSDLLSPRVTYSLSLSDDWELETPLCLRLLVSGLGDTSATETGSQ